MNKPNPYVCKLLRRLDGVYWRLRGEDVYWTIDGTLCARMKAGHGVELPTVFPAKWHLIAADVQNRWPITRRVLSA